MKKILLSSIILILFLFDYANTQTPKIKWWFDTYDSSYGQSAMADVDGDGKQELVFGCYRNDSCVYVLNAEDGSLHWKFNAAGSMEGCNDTAPLIYDINGDGIGEIIVASSCNPLTYCFDGKTGEIIWQSKTRGSDSPPTIGDIDGDGNLEILHGQFGGYIICFDALTGSRNWEIEVDKNSWIQTAPTLVDLNDDGNLDFVVATWHFEKNNRMLAYNGLTKEIIWSLSVDDVVYHGTALSDVNKDGKPDLILGDYSGKLWVVNGYDGSINWNYKAPYGLGAAVAVGDVNGDGECEIIIASYFKIIALNPDGSELWVFNTPKIGSVFRGVILVDINDDKLPEILFGNSAGVVYALNGTNGKMVWDLDLANHIGKDFELDHAPVVGDFDQDGNLDLFIVGGHTDYPDFSKNYGRAYAIEIGKGSPDQWSMFQKNERRSCGECYKKSTRVNEAIINHPANEIDLSKLIPGKEYSISLFDYVGNLSTFRLVYNANSKLTVFDDLGLSSGIYFVFVYELDKQLITNGKIFVNK